MDPFAGSNVALSAINDLVRPRKVVAIEIIKVSCLRVEGCFRDQNLLG